MNMNSNIDYENNNNANINNNIKKQTPHVNDLMNSKNNNNMVIGQIPNNYNNKNYNKNINNNIITDTPKKTEMSNANKNLERNIGLNKVDINNCKDVKKIINDKKVYALWKKFKGIESDSNEDIARSSRKKNSKYHIHKFSNNSISSSDSDNDDSSDSDFNDNDSYTHIHNIIGLYSNNHTLHSNCTNNKNLNNRCKLLDEKVPSKIYHSCNNYQQHQYKKNLINNSLPDINSYRINTFIPQPNMAHKLSIYNNQNQVKQPLLKPYHNYINQPNFSSHSTPLKNEFRNNPNLYNYYHQNHNEQISANINNLINNSSGYPFENINKNQHIENPTLKPCSRSYKNINEVFIISYKINLLYL